jgi:hypothetical protein
MRVPDAIAGAFKAGDSAKSPELRQHPFGAALLEKGGGGDAAKLQVLFVDPLFFAGEPLQGVANGGGVGEFGDEPGEGDRFDGRGRELAGSGQMPG